MSFNPYHHWLGIPPSDQSESHYRLLGLQDLEQDVEVIAHAVNCRLLYLQELKSGPHADHAGRLMEHILMASHCLLNADTKMAYDQVLRSQASQESRTDAPTHSHFLTAETDPLPRESDQPPLVQIVARRPGRPIRRRRHRRSHLPGQLFAIILGGICGIGLGTLILWKVFDVSPTELRRQVEEGARHAGQPSVADQRR
jgi:hypothetical protein